MKAIKFQQDILNDMANVRYGYIADSFVAITVRGYYIYIMPKGWVYLNLEKIGSANCHISEIVTNSHPTITVTRTKIERVLSNGTRAVLFTCDNHDIYINKKYLAYCDKKC